MSTGSSSDPSATLTALAGEAQLADRVRFVVELDPLKQVLRCAVVTDGRRRECWLEFENGTTADARFARALDRLQPYCSTTHPPGRRGGSTASPPPKSVP